MRLPICASLMNLKCLFDHLGPVQTKLGVKGPITTKRPRIQPHVKSAPRVEKFEAAPPWHLCHDTTKCKTTYKLTSCGSVLEAIEFMEVFTHTACCSSVISPPMQLLFCVLH